MVLNGVLDRVTFANREIRYTIARIKCVAPTRTARAPGGLPRQSPARGAPDAAPHAPALDNFLGDQPR